MVRLCTKAPGIT